MRPAVYFANCLYKSGQTSGIQDTEDTDTAPNSALTATLLPRSSSVASSSTNIAIRTHAVSDFIIGNRKTPHQQTIVRIQPLMTS